MLIHHFLGQTIESSEITNNTIDFTDFSRFFILDANTSITQDGTETFTITNSGTGNTIIDLTSTETL